MGHSAVEKRHATGASALGALATGASAVGSFAVGALAVAAMAVGALAIGRLKVGAARLEQVAIGRLTVEHLDIGYRDRRPGDLTATVRLRALPGKGEALARLLSQMPAERAFGLLERPGRSLADPDIFVLSARYPDEAAFEREAGSPGLALFHRRLVLEGLIAGTADDPLDVHLTRTVA